MTINVTPNTVKAVTEALKLASLLDDRVASPDKGRILGWAEQIHHARISDPSGEVLCASVQDFYDAQHDRPISVGDLITGARAIMRDRWERTDPDDRPTFGDAKTAQPDPQAGYARGVYVEHDPAGWPYANAATREERANADTELRARVKARIKATPRGETPPTEAEAETAIRLEDRERAEKFLRRRDLAGLIEGLGAQPGSTRRPAPAFSEPRRPTNP